LATIFDYFYFSLNGKPYYRLTVLRAFSLLVVMIYPILFLISELDNINDCCIASANFSPEHRVSLYVIIAVSMAAYVISLFKIDILSPILEVLLNVFLLIGIIINVLISIQLSFPFGAIGNIPIILLFIIALFKNQQLIITKVKNDDYETESPINFIAWKILTLHPLMKYPILLIAILPIVLILTSILVLFGQKPDALIRAFTETYKHGLSQWDYKCENVECGGHYLCSVAANGHKEIVKPQRLGFRAGGIIVCNRQLLVSNAFEQVIEELFPNTHKRIRKTYDQVGDIIHKNHRLFENKYVCDVVYILMKPTEWIFILTIYITDKNPEQRIAFQYLDRKRSIIF
jgi:hypothetical protein